MSIKKLGIALVLTSALTGSSLAAQSYPNGGFENDRPDLSALRYFAQNNQFDYYRAELTRLTKKFPGFTPPQNIFENADESNDEIWALFSTGNMVAVEAEIAHRQEEDPYWKPDENLVIYLETAKKYDQVGRYHQAGNSQKLIEYVLQNPDLLKQSVQSTVVMVGEALADLGKPAASFEMFNYGLNKDASSGFASLLLQKSARYLPVADALYLYEKASQNSDANIDDIKTSFARGLVLRTKERAYEFPSHLIETINEFGEHAKVSEDYADLQNLAWAFYALADYKQSKKWFSYMPKTTDHAKSVEGEILSLKHLEERKEALVLADKWQNLSDDIAALYINLSAPKLLAEKVKKLDSEFLANYASVANRLNSGEGAEALGWYAYNVNQFKAADAWFTKAIAWELTETAAFGKTLTAARTKNRDQFNTLKAEYSGQFQRVASLKYRQATRLARSNVRIRPSLSEKMSKAYNQGKYSKCAQIFQSLNRGGGATAHNHQMYGWCLMKLNRADEAKRAFEIADAGAKRSKSSNRSVALYGAALAALKAGRTAEASRIANTGKLSRQEYAVIRKEVLALQALETFRGSAFRQTVSLLNERQRYAQEPANLTELRGWSMYKLGKYRQALALFEQLDGRLSTKKTRNAVRITHEKVYPSQERY